MGQAEEAQGEQCLECVQAWQVGFIYLDLKQLVASHICLLSDLELRGGLMDPARGGHANSGQPFLC